MTASILNRRHLDFLIFEWLGADSLLDRSRFEDHSVETLTAVLDLAERIAEKEILPHYKLADRDEPELCADGVHIHPDVARAVRTFGAAGLAAGPFDFDLGGLQLPELVHAGVMANCMAAGIGTAAYSMLSIGNARLLAEFAKEPQREAFARPQVAGAALGTMCLSEPQAGSSLADITTRALPDGSDERGSRFRIFGNKMWISGGDHDITDDIFHLVLAKIPDAEGRLPQGTKGISLFLVPKRLPSTDGRTERNDVAVAGLNHKMGYRATCNCLLNFGEGTYRPGGNAGAIGYLVGEEGAGVKVMFHMMNEARIAVGLGAAALACRSHLLSLAYAGDRRQGRLPGSIGGPPVAIIEHADVRRLLALQKTYAEGALALVLYCARLVDDARTAPDEDTQAEARLCLDILTPVAKTWPSEWGLAACDIGIQIHGGYGYTRDFDVEQLYRDNRLNPIHEGTTGIQGLDLVGRKLRKESAAGLRALTSRVRVTVAAATARGLASEAAAVEASWTAVETVSATLIGRDEAQSRWHATAFLSAFGHAVVGWLWLDQAVAAATVLAQDRERAQPGHDAEFYAAKLRCCRCFIELELPKVGQWLAEVEAGSDAAAFFPLDALRA